jgi:hypothetical protein
MFLASFTLVVELVLVMFIHTALPWSTSSVAVFRRLEKRLCERENVRPMVLVNSGWPRTVRTPGPEDL